MEDGRLHRSGLRIIDGGLARERATPRGTATPHRPAELPVFRMVDVVVSYLDLPGADAPAILMLPADRHQQLSGEDWLQIQRALTEP